MFTYLPLRCALLLFVSYIINHVYAKHVWFHLFVFNLLLHFLTVFHQRKKKPHATFIILLLLFSLICLAISFVTFSIQAFVDKQIVVSYLIMIKRNPLVKSYVFGKMLNEVLDNRHVVHIAQNYEVSQHMRPTLI